MDKTTKGLMDEFKENLDTPEGYRALHGTEKVEQYDLSFVIGRGWVKADRLMEGLPASVFMIIIRKKDE